MGKTAALLVALGMLACWPAAHAQQDPVPDANPAQGANPLQDGTAGHGQIVSIGHDADLPAGERAQEVVAVFGAASAAGEVQENLVAVFGDAHASGPIHENVVAVFGDVQVEGPVDGDVVAVFGNVELGPHAQVNGEVIDVLGRLERSATAVIRGDIERVLPADLHGLRGLHAWIHHGLLYGRPLALDAGLDWAWAVALAALALYLLLAVLFADALQRCVRTLEAQPGRSILAAILTLLLTPMVVVLLMITVLGIPLVPVALAGLFCAAVFGKAAVLAWLGGRAMRWADPRAAAPAVLTVLVGGLIALLLYSLPVIGFIAFTLLSVLGLGAALNALIQSVSSARGPALATGHAAAGAAGAASAGPATAGTATAGAAFAASGAAPGAQAAPSNSSPTGEASGTSGAAAGTPGAASSTPGANAPGVPAAAPVVLDPAGLPRAGFWIRMGALFIDVLIVMVVLGVLGGHDQHEGLSLLALAGYAAVMWKLKGTTVGGLVCDLRVLRLDAQPIDWGTAVARALGCILSLIVAGLGFIWIAVDPEQQAWHDKIAGTVVVRLGRRASPARG